MLWNDQAEVIFFRIPIKSEYRDLIYLFILIYAPIQ